jgi:hypothetical protein
VLLYRAPQTAAALDAARQSAQMNIMRARQIAGLTEPDAILLSYQFNDLLAVYGRRSVLNYRQMIPYDEATHKYDYKKFEPLLVAEIQRLLEAGMPVYYVVDRQPSLYKSFEILQSHFRVAVVGGDEAVYRVQPTD